MATISTIINGLKKIQGFALDLVLPPNPIVREIEEMDASRAIDVFKRPEIGPQSWIKSLFSYRDERVNTAIWELKYRGNKKIATLFGGILADYILEEMVEGEQFGNFRAPLLIPIPLSRARERERGFNQCRLVLEEVTKRTPDIEVSYGALQKIKNTKPQTCFKKKADRLKNLRGAFAANAPQVLDRNIILFDDVLTTGSTLTEARRVLLDAGAHKVIAYTLAH